jgi:hypothetical protein
VNAGTGAPSRMPSRGYAERAAGAAPSADEALDAVRHLLQRRLRCDPLVYSMGGEGEEPRRIAADSAGVQPVLDELFRGRQAGLPTPFILADSPTDPQVVLSFGVDVVAGIEYLDLPLASDVDEPGDASKVGALVGSVGSAFGAHTGFVEDDALASLYYGRRVAEISRASLPPELRDRVPSWEPPHDAAGTLPELLVFHEFDRELVPRAVFWINYWNAAQVDTLGRERVLSAPWQRAEPSAHGALTLVATEKPPDIARTKDLERLRRLVEHLGLREAQERHRRT